MSDNFIAKLSKCNVCARRYTRVASLYSSVINDRIRLSGGIGRVIKCERALPRGITFEKGASRLDRCTSVKRIDRIARENFTVISYGRSRVMNSTPSAGTSL